MVIDRNSRDRLAETIQLFLDDELTSFAFDDAIFEIASHAEDLTVDYATNSLWHHYSDCLDHQAVLSKPEWDYFYRLMLLLKSDGHVRVNKKKCSSGKSQGIAAICLVAVLAGAWAVGFNILAFFVFALGVLISMILASWRKRLVDSSRQKYWGLSPFASISQLRYFREKVSEFKKRPYPEDLSKRQIRSVWVEQIMFLPMRFAWMICSPLVLAFQVMPKYATWTSVE